MTTKFFRFPHTPHLAWLGNSSPRDDKVLSHGEVASLLSGEVVVEEKLDGANVGLSLDANGNLVVQNRGQYLSGPHTGQFARLPSWLVQHADSLYSMLTPNIILFGEWCAARHSLDYVALPDWLLIFDVYDRAMGRFWSTSRRNALATSTGLVTVPQLLKIKTSLDSLKQLVITQQSHYRKGPLEGIVVRRESAEWCEARAKLVRPDFTQAINIHWRKRVIEWNRVSNEKCI
ncbi:DNA ligase [Klebsiella oxytoca]|uniref:RNA ligase family protein n=1 Tax=Klebsiella oxytoca TaxID=571 RepID=UPI001CCF5EFC|nr:RNA ligase family protein [Klebsiella oxytoca]MBZ7685909.1 DNA ligase [Klebsiella oxytoca]GJK67841.1 DNA ligase III [Klebsiella oxytoca]